jgi:hypothetical protein
MTALLRSVSSLSPHALRAQVAFPQMTPAFPVFDGLHPRQDSSTCVSTGHTICPDGNGCCATDAACTTTVSGGNAYPICAADCNDGPICTTPIKACCLLGLTCAPDGLCNTPAGKSTEVEASITLPTAISFKQMKPTTALPASILSASARPRALSKSVSAQRKAAWAQAMRFVQPATARRLLVS